MAHLNDGAATPSPRQTPKLLGDMTVFDFREGYDRGDFTCEQVIQTLIDRIEELNPRFGAISIVNPDAMKIAKLRDNERRDGIPLGRLHGIPVLLKDMFLTTDAMPSTVGCSGLVGATPSFESELVRILRDEGAILLGKTVPTQWANYRSAGRMPNGWSANDGQCRGIFGKDQEPCGSSTGSAVAVALGLAPIAFGTETSGSIASPARSAGVVGVKPTAGLISGHGVYSVSKQQDSVGVLAKTVREAAMVLDVVAHKHKDTGQYIKVAPSDDCSLPDDPHGQVAGVVPPMCNFAVVCDDSKALSGMRIAVPWDIIKCDEFVMEQFRLALHTMKMHGASVVEDVHFTRWSLSTTKMPHYETAFQVDLIENMNEYLACFKENPNGLITFRDVMAYTAKTAEEENDLWGMDTWEQSREAAEKYPPGSEEYEMSVKLRKQMSTQIQELLDAYKCDVIAAPWSTNTSATVAGCPQISVPLPAYPEGTKEERPDSSLITIGPNIPTSIMFVGRREDDATVIRAAHAFEQVTQHRKLFKPDFKSNVELPCARVMI
ncbi:hypothetical protein L204_104752 [Cryptococcus depauperatus]|nr:hypothetical protein L204_05250 [Cryptococcus depauperatus CBS 7855]